MFSLSRQTFFASMKQTLPISFALVGVAGLALLAEAPAQALTYRTALAPEIAGAAGTGLSTIRILEPSNQMKINIAFSGMTGSATRAHVHGPTAAAGVGNAGVMSVVPSFPDFPVGYPNGTYQGTFDLLASTTYNPSFIAANGGTASGARSAFLAALADGKAYLNVHTTTFPAGEIRGFYAEIGRAHV